MFDPRVQRHEQLIDAEREFGQWKLKIDRVERGHRTRLEIFRSDGQSFQPGQKLQQIEQTVERTRVELTAQTEIFDRTGAGELQRHRTERNAETQRTESKFLPSENQLAKFVDEISISRGQRADFHCSKMFGRSAEQLQKLFRQAGSMQSQGDQVREVEE